MSDTPGKGCMCHAHSESECGCDVDWTPREVYELRAQRDRLAEAIKRYIAEDYTLVALQRTLAAVEGGSDEISNS
jgi:hypothetical protein